MIFGLFAIISTGRTPNFSGILEAQAKSSQFTASYYSSNLQGDRATIWVNRPKQVEAKIYFGNSPDHGPMNRMFLVDSKKRLDIDVPTRTYILRPIQGTKKAEKESMTFIQSLPLAARPLLLPSGLAPLISGGKAGLDWKHLSANSPFWTASTPYADLKLTYDSKKVIVSKLALTPKNGITNYWTFSLKSSPPPINSLLERKVKFLTTPPGEPSFSDHSAEVAYRRAVARYSRPDDLNLSIGTKSEERVGFSSGPYYFSSEGCWKYSDGVGYIHTAKGDYVGKVDPNEFIDALDGAGFSQLNLLARRLLLDQNFAVGLMGFGYLVKSEGEMTLGGKQVTLCGVYGPAVKILLSIGNDGLISSVDSTAYDQSGAAMSESKQTYRPAESAFEFPKLTSPFPIAGLIKPRPVKPFPF